MAAPPASDMAGDPLLALGGPRATAGPSLSKRSTRHSGLRRPPPGPAVGSPGPRRAPESAPGLGGKTPMACQDGKAMADGASEAPTRVPGTESQPGPTLLTVPVGVGRRALVVANLSLKPEATSATTWAAAGLARALDTWEGPGLVVIAGNLL